MTEPVPNTQLANNSPPIFLNYYLLKSIFHFCCPKPNVGGAGAALPWGSYMIDMLYLLHFLGLVLLLSCRGSSQSFCRSPCPRILQPHLCLSAQPLAAGNFIYQSEPTGSRDPQRFTFGFSCNFGNPDNIMQALSRIHNSVESPHAAAAACV